MTYYQSMCAKCELEKANSSKKVLFPILRLIHAIVPSPEEHQCSTGDFKEQLRTFMASCIGHNKAGRCVWWWGASRTHPVKLPLKLLGINIKKGAIKTVDILACFAFSPRAYWLWKQGDHICWILRADLEFWECRDYKEFIPFSSFCFFSSVMSSRDYCVSRRYQKLTITATGVTVVSMANQSPSLQKFTFIQTTVSVMKLVVGTWERVGEIDRLGREGLSQDLTFKLRTE